MDNPKPKFALEQEVFVFANYGRTQCYTCEGARSISIKGKDFRCPNCDGLGHVKDPTVKKVQRAGKICEITIRRSGHIHYLVGLWDTRYEEYQLFASEEECMKPTYEAVV